MPDKRDEFTIWIRSEAIACETVLKKVVGKISRQQEEEFGCCMISFKFFDL